MIDMVGDSRNSNTVKQPQGKKVQRMQKFSNVSANMFVRNRMEMWKFPRSKISSEKTVTEEEDDKLEEAGCISLRAVGVVICTLCGHSWKGRIRKIWGVHPMRVYSKDVFSCTNCGVNDLESLEEHCLPHGVQKPANVMVLGGQGTYLCYL